MYNGIKEITLTDEQLADFYANKTIPIGLTINQYVLFKNTTGDYIDKHRYDGNKLIKVKNKTISNSLVGDIKALNVKQSCFIDLLYNDSVPVKVVTGGFGVGKTLLSVSYALENIQSGKYKKLVIIRNNVDVKDVPSLGALPGTENDKMRPYVAFISDIVSEELFDIMIQKHQIEVAYLGSIRGRSFKDSCVICSEAENLTKEHAKLIVGRIDKNSTLIFDGDLQQTDKTVFEKNSGLSAIINSLSGNPLVGFVELDKVERSEVAKLAELIN